MPKSHERPVRWLHLVSGADVASMSVRFRLGLSISGWGNAQTPPKVRWGWESTAREKASSSFVWRGLRRNAGHETPVFGRDVEALLFTHFRWTGQGPTPSPFARSGSTRRTSHAPLRCPFLNHVAVLGARTTIHHHQRHSTLGSFIPGANVSWPLIEGGLPLSPRNGPTRSPRRRWRSLELPPIAWDCDDFTSLLGLRSKHDR
ncbi:uncharacterized protein THITE_2111361 [Thermothielavioides terrestris NRRL 8126]|uniref:Uncharacterized protein n=1 Tax=Thermothielavioides terrestris (strain ATCC 38088 / NRRL 8126) TaxID=578455 RepID=G2R290_THETT|nr:uncharacterized protein THITE_2111361 [Thermothielavioides terrestris NRRL 8126]AEO64958.1 hypothetical protein THITE_2111361 [Thermothielavioides terrestris NRRL 8126]